jgi:glycosyltransferase involved in cell wall biosynthesis
MQPIDRLLIVSHVKHYRHAGRLYALAPYVREINVWAELFPQLVIASPFAEGPPPGDAEAFASPNITVLPQRELGGNTWAAKFRQLLMLPLMIWDLCRALRQCEAVHVRCPGNLGLLGVFLAPLFCRYRIAKYAGEWQGYPNEAPTYRLQRWILASRWWQAPVTVYGDYPPQPAHVIPFFTSVMGQAQMDRARAAVARRQQAPASSGQPLRLLFVGRLTHWKNVDVLLTALAQLGTAARPWECLIAGSGPESENLQRQAQELGIADRVRFAGAVDFDRVLDFYEQSDVLVLVSSTEGWGKVLVEAMAFGLICIASDRGVVPWMLGDGRGVVIPPRDPAALADALRHLEPKAPECQQMRQRATHWAQQLTLEALREALRKVLEQHWDRPLATSAAPAEQTAAGKLASLSERTEHSGSLSLP